MGTVCGQEVPTIGQEKRIVLGHLEVIGRIGHRSARCGNSLDSVQSANHDFAILIPGSAQGSQRIT